VNPTLRETVTLAGTLKGHDLELPCTIKAVKVSAPKLDISEYVKAQVIDAPPILPDGNYELHFEGRSLNTTKLNGRWI
jgi:hypothetical protein